MHVTYTPPCEVSHHMWRRVQHPTSSNDSYIWCHSNCLDEVNSPRWCMVEEMAPMISFFSSCCPHSFFLSFKEALYI